MILPVPWFNNGNYAIRTDHLNRRYIINDAIKRETGKHINKLQQNLEN